MAESVIDNPGRHRFEFAADGSTAFVEYAEADGNLVLTHTEVPEALGGRGIGSKLARGVLDEVRRSGRKIVAECPFIASFIERHDEYQDLLA